uniref:Uncharacterized protein n=1 Tax=Rhizophora mucronata TaxID=61149 RepID=A0A2P2P279_RHIMU
MSTNILTIDMIIRYPKAVDPASIFFYIMNQI